MRGRYREAFLGYECLEPHPRSGRTFDSYVCGILIKIVCQVDVDRKSLHSEPMSLLTQKLSLNSF